MQLRSLFTATLLVALAAALAAAGLTRDLGPLEHLPMGTLVASLLIGAFVLSRRALLRA